MSQFKWILCVFVVGYSFFSSHVFGITHMSIKYDSRPRYALDKEAEKIGKIYHLKLISSGLGSVAGSDTAPWGLLLTSKEKCTLEQSKSLAQNVADLLLRKMYEDSDFANYYKEPDIACAAHSKRDGRLCYVNPKSLAFRIDFWDENVDRQLYPYCAEIRLADGVFYYYYADPKTQALQEPVVEPFVSTVRNPFTS